MTIWNLAYIKFQYSPHSKPDYRLISQVSTQVHGKSESAAMAQLRKLYGRTLQDFVILKLD